MSKRKMLILLAAVLAASVPVSCGVSRQESRTPEMTQEEKAAEKAKEETESAFGNLSIYWAPESPAGKPIDKLDTRGIAVFVIRDPGTGVEYLVYDGFRKGGITPRLTADGELCVRQD